MRKLAIPILATLALALLVAQLVPVELGNPPVETEVPAPPEVRSILRRACYDCHSNETRWPWYSHFAPVSWLLAHDVGEGREMLNLSTWNRLGTKKRVEAFHEIRETVESGEMPPWLYLGPHPDARLSASDRQALLDWSGSAAQGGAVGD